MRKLDIGVISDTHGPVRPEALAALEGCDLIVHAGDIGKPEALDQLRAIAPTWAVRGNNDADHWADALPHEEVVEAGPHHLYVVHELEHLDLDPVAAAFSAVITGHSHRPSVDVEKGVLYLNPGSAGPRRFTLPIALARLEVTARALRPHIIELDIRAAEEAAFSEQFLRRIRAPNRTPIGQ